METATVANNSWDDWQFSHKRHDDNVVSDDDNEEEEKDRSIQLLGYNPSVRINGVNEEWLKQHADCFFGAKLVEHLPVFIDDRPNLSSSSTGTTRWLRVLDPFQPELLTEKMASSWIAVMSQHRQSPPPPPYHPALSLMLNIHNPISSNDQFRNSCSPLSVLQQSCLKRQMVGWYLPMFPPTYEISTFLVLESSVNDKSNHPWEFQVQSISLQKPSRSSREECSNVTSFAMILPSTRITFVNTAATMDTKSNEDRTNTSIENDWTKFKTFGRPKDVETMLQMSPPACILVDTIRCCSMVSSSSSNIDGRISSRLDVPRGFLFTGPPGVGKTHAVRLAVEITGAHLTVLSGSDVMADTDVNSSAAKKLELEFVKAVKKATLSSLYPVAVIFLDECDGLLSHTSTSSSSVVMETMLGTLLDRINDVQTHGDWKRLVVVAATNRIDGIPTSLRRPGRFDRELTLAAPDATARFHILKAMLSMQQNSTVGRSMDENRIHDIADACVGYVPADLAAMVSRMRVLRMLEQPGKSIDDYELLEMAMSDVGASALRDAALKAPPQTTWDDVAGDPGGAKTALRRAIEWPKRPVYKSFRGLLSPPRGILLHGPPGCAKTTLARAAAGTSASSFLSLSPAEVFASSYVGEAEQIIRRAFSIARSAAPCVLFFDEIDAILGSEESSHSGGMGRGSHAEARVLSTFLNEMDGIDNFLEDGVLVLGATNRPWTLDAALLRPGRFDKCIYVPPPDLDGRKSILQLQTCNWPTWIDVDRFAQLTENMTGAEIVGACRAACMTGVIHSCSNEPQIRSKDLEEEIKNVKPLLSDPRVLWEYQHFDENRKRQS